MKKKINRYIKHGILFKFATDPVVGMRNDKKVYLFGGSVASDEEAVKVLEKNIDFFFLFRIQLIIFLKN